MIEITSDEPGHSLKTLLWQAVKLYDTKALLPLLRDKDSLVRTTVARELQVRGDVLTFDEAMVMGHSKKASEREIAAFLLGQLGTPNFPFKERSIPVLETQLEKDKNAAVRATAAASLGHLQSESSVPLLINASTDAHADVRIAVAFALSIFPDNRDATKCLKKLSMDKDKDVRHRSE
jgi:HEAT repeat protein